MTRTHEALDQTLRSFIADPPLFFVASAPAGPDGLAEYWGEKNETSINGLPGHPGAAP